MSASPDEAVASELILALCASCVPGRTLDPGDVAKAIAAREGLAEGAWRSLLGAVRRNAARLAEEGKIAIYRKGKPVDPRDFKGVYRLGPTR